MKNNNTVSVSFMLLGILFCVCLVAANLLETKVVQIVENYGDCRTGCISYLLHYQ